MKATLYHRDSKARVCELSVFRFHGSNWSAVASEPVFDGDSYYIIETETGRRYEVFIKQLGTAISGSGSPDD